MAPDDLARIRFFRKEWRVIRGAPWTFMVFVAIVSGIVWAVIDWRYSGVIQNLESTIQNKDSLIDGLRQGVGLEDRQATKLSVRPWAIGLPGPVFHVTGKSGLQAYVLIANVGEREALDVIAKAGLFVGPSMRIQDVGQLGSYTEQIGPMLVGARLRSDSSILLRGEVLEESRYATVRKGDLRIYTFGRISFKDSKGKEYREPFCWMYFGEDTAKWRDGQTYYPPAEAKPCEGTWTSDRYPFGQ